MDFVPESDLSKVEATDSDAFGFFLRLVLLVVPGFVFGAKKFALIHVSCLLIPRLGGGGNDELTLDMVSRHCLKNKMSSD